MSKRIKRNIMIHQQYLSIGVDGATRLMVLIETNGSLPVKTYSVELPKDFIFYHEKYQYYVINSN